MMELYGLILGMQQHLVIPPAPLCSSHLTVALCYFATLVKIKFSNFPFPPFSWRVIRTAFSPGGLDTFFTSFICIARLGKVSPDI